MMDASLYSPDPNLVPRYVAYLVGKDEARLSPALS